MNNEPNILDKISRNTVFVMIEAPEKQREWLLFIRETLKQAIASEDKQLIILLNAVVQLLTRKPLNEINPNLTGAYLLCWKSITNNIQKHSDALDSASDPVEKAVLLLLNTREWSARERIIRQSQTEILSKDADKVLDELAAQYSKENVALGEIAAARELIVRCRDEGIDSVFNSPRKTLDSKVIPAVQELARAVSISDIMKIIQEKAGLLLTDDADVFLKMMQEMQTNEKARLEFGEIRQILKACREKGIEKTFANIENARQVLAPSQYVTNFLEADRWMKKKQIVSKNLDILLSQSAADVFSYFAESFGNEPILRIEIEQHKRILRECERNGVDFAFSPYSNIDRAWALRHESRKLRGSTNMTQRLQLILDASRLADKELDIKLWVYLQGELARVYLENPEGNKSDNIEKAIEYANSIQGYFTDTRFRDEKLALNANLGSAYFDRQLGQRNQNCQSGLACYLSASLLARQVENTQMWGGIQYNILHGVTKRTREVLKGSQNARLEWANILEDFSCQSQLRNNELQEYLRIVVNFLRDIAIEREDINQLQGMYSESWSQIQEGRDGALESNDEKISKMKSKFDKELEEIARLADEAAADHKLWSLVIERLETILKSDAVEKESVKSLGLAKFLLSSCYLEYYNISGSDGLAEKCIALIDETQALFAGVKYAATWGYNLKIKGDAYRERYFRTGNNEYFEKAEDVYFEIVGSLGQIEDLPLRTAIDMSLGTLYFHAFEIKGETKYADKSVEFFNRGLKVYQDSQNTKACASVMQKIGNLYRVWYRWTNNNMYAQQTEQMHLSVFSINEELNDEFGMAGAKHNLGGLYSGIYDREFDIAYFFKAEKSYLEALKVRTKEKTPYNWAVTTGDLAKLYASYYGYSKNSKSAESATSLFLDSLTVLQQELYPALWASTHHNLGNLLRLMYINERNELHADSAMSSYQKALTIYSSDAAPAETSAIQVALAGLLKNRFEHTGKDEYAREAISVCNNILPINRRKSSPALWSSIHILLGDLLAELFNRSNNLLFARKAKKHLLLILQAKKISHAYIPSVHSFSAAKELLLLEFSQQNWEGVIEAYHEVEKWFKEIYQIQVLREGKETSLKLFGELSSLVAYAFIKRNQHKEAAIALELGRSFMLNETLQRTKTDLQALVKEYPDAARTYNEISNRIALLEKLEASGKNLSEVAEERLKANIELKQLIDRIHLITGYEGFLADFTLNELVAIASVLPIVYLGVTPMGGYALVVYKNGIDGLILDTDKSELDNIFIKTENNKVVGGYLPGQTNIHWLKDSLVEVSDILSDKFILPVAAKLVEINAKGVAIIAVGRLGLLPLHAIQVSQNGSSDYFLDKFDVSFIPSAQILSVLHKSLNSIYLEAPTLVGVGNPLPASVPLPYAKFELERIEKLFSPNFARTFYEYSANKNEFIDSLEGAKYVHISCHGQFIPSAPLLSSLQLANSESLTLKEILEIQQLKKCRLVVLSACQTAISDFIELPNESIGFPAGFIQAGALGVVGALWSVEDRSTSLLMEKFYEAIIVLGMSPVQALRQAQIWLRNVSRHDLSEHYKNIDSADAKKAYLEMSLDGHPNDKPYSHPYYWAAYTFTGI